MRGSAVLTISWSSMASMIASSRPGSTIRTSRLAPDGAPASLSACATVTGAPACSRAGHCAPQGRELPVTAHLLADRLVPSVRDARYLPAVKEIAGPQTGGCERAGRAEHERT